MFDLRVIVYVLLILLNPHKGLSEEDHNVPDRLERPGIDIKGDSTRIGLTLDSARVAFQNDNFDVSIEKANRSFELSKKFPNADFAIQSVLLLARSYRMIYLANNSQRTFNNTLKYYIKAITLLESVGSKRMLADIYTEYGDFYFELNLPHLTIQNYEKALRLVEGTEDYLHQKIIIEKVAFLNYEMGNLEQAILYYIMLHNLHKSLKEEERAINTLKKLSELYLEYKDYDNALYASKEILSYYKKVDDVQNQVFYLSKIGEISYSAGNNDQAVKSFKEYFSLVKNSNENLNGEKSSVRYIQNLIIVGDIYKLSTENGYLTDYELAIRHFNLAQKITDFIIYPKLAVEILKKTGEIYFRKGDYKTCLTYFDLSLYYAKKTKDLENISQNYLLLARAYNEIEKWEEASDHYEQHAAFKDSIIQQKEAERQFLANQAIDFQKENLKITQTLDMIEAHEIQELTLAEKELRNIALESELEIYRQDAELKEALIQNQKLSEDSAVRNYLLTKHQLENEINTKKIEQLNSDREKQDLLLKNKEADQQNKRQRIKILEQENSLAKSRQAYYMLFIILISLILVLILVVYILKRKANKKLKAQNEKIELQSQNLMIANKNIGKQNSIIEEQNQQLLSISKEKNHLINILAHDLRNPLATAMSMIELVRFEEENLSSEQRQASEIIWRGLQRMNNMITKILDIKAVESQKINLDFEIVNAEELFSPLKLLFKEEADRKEINLHFANESHEPFINVDRSYLVQVMENLISNALKFSPSKSNIFIKISDEEEHVRISVKDEGPGIPDNEISDLFKKYHKLSPRPTDGEQSIGLGLSIVKKYVEVMQGKVWCKCDKGKGSEFIVEFRKEQVPVS